MTISFRPITRSPNDQYSDDQCAICQEEFGNGPFVAHEDPAKEGLSIHPFHEKCLEQWLRTVPICPLCKRITEAPPPLPGNRVIEVWRNSWLVRTAVLTTGTTALFAVETLFFQHTQLPWNPLTATGLAATLITFGALSGFMAYLD